MRNKLSEFLAALHGCLLVLLIFLPMIIVIFPQQKELWYRGFLVLLPAAASSWGIRRIKRLTVYLGLGICISAALYFTASSFAEQIYLPLASALIFLCRIPARLHRNRDFLDSPSVLSLIAFAVIYIAGMFLHETSFCEISYRLAFCDVVILILYTNLTGLTQFLEQNRDMANLPGKQIIRTNQVMLTFFLAAALIGMLLLPATGLANAFSLLGDGLLWLIRKLLSLIPASTGEAVVETTEAAAEAMSNEVLAIPESNTPAWLTALYNFIAYALGTVLLIAVIIGVIFAIIQVFKRFYQPIQENSDKQEFIHEEKADIMARTPGGQKEPSLRFRFQPDAAIRKIYKKAIKRGLRSETQNPIQQSDTPAQLEKKASLASEEPEQLLHHLYEKARYSDQECTREELNRLKSAGYK